jgi:hypothetical protein
VGCSSEEEESVKPVEGAEVEISIAAPAMAAAPAETIRESMCFSMLPNRGAWNA